MSQNNKAAPQIMWILTMILFFYQFVARSSFPTVLADQFMQHFHIDATGMGVLASCYYWVYTFMQVPSGVIIDRVSTRMISTICTAVCAGGVLVFIATSNYVIAGIGQMMIGFGSSFAFLLNLKILSSWFPANQIPMKCSYTIAVGCMGPVVGGPLVSLATVGNSDWMDVMLAFAGIGLILSALMWMVIKDKNETPEAQKKGEKAAISMKDTLKLIVTSKQVWILATFTMLIYAPLSALGDLWGVAFIKKAYDVETMTATLMNNMLYVGMVIGSPAFARLAVAWNSYKKPMILGMATATVSLGMIIFGVSRSIEIAFILFFLTGFACGAQLSYPLALVLFPKEIGGSVTGFINMLAMLSGVILMPLIGWIVNLSWDGTMENGMKVYGDWDFRVGLTSVLLFLLAGICISMMVKDRSPSEERAE
ncbi:MAG: MFS transporter [Holosporaceae bacterium]|jgi:MFS family permease|nr:MFS transporter [Holosporaceae bacterium]